MATLAIKRSDGGVTIREVKGSYDLEKEKEQFESRLRSVKNGWTVVEIKEINPADLPASRNYRDAWKHNLDIDLEKAKELQKRLMVQKAVERAQDDFGQVPQSVKDEIAAIDTSTANDLTALYNMWPTSIERRNGKREYVVKGRK